MNKKFASTVKNKLFSFALWLMRKQFFPKRKALKVYAAKINNKISSLKRKARFNVGHVSRRNRTNLHFKFKKKFLNDIKSLSPLISCFDWRNNIFYWNCLELKLDANGTRSKAIVLAINFKSPGKTKWYKQTS